MNMNAVLNEDVNIWDLCTFKDHSLIEIVTIWRDNAQI
jgi:hypothetical protein